MDVADSEVFCRAATIAEQAAQGLADSRGRDDWITLLQASAVQVAIGHVGQVFLGFGKILFLKSFDALLKRITRRLFRER